MSQKTFVRTVSDGVNSPPLALVATTAAFAAGRVKNAPSNTIAPPCTSPNTKNVCRYPLSAIMCEIGITVMADPSAYPAAIIPEANPRRSGNNFRADPMHVPNTHPIPKPPMAAATYKLSSECACEFSTHDAPAAMPPTITTKRGPQRSATQPSAGASQVLDRKSVVQGK